MFSNSLLTIALLHRRCFGLHEETKVQSLLKYFRCTDVLVFFFFCFSLHLSTTTERGFERSIRTHERLFGTALKLLRLLNIKDTRQRSCSKRFSLRRHHHHRCSRRTPLFTINKHSAYLM